MKKTVLSMYKDKPSLIIAASAAVLIIFGFVAIGDFAMFNRLTLRLDAGRWFWTAGQLKGLFAGLMLGCLALYFKDKLLKFSLPLAVAGLLLAMSVYLPNNGVVQHYLYGRFVEINGVVFRASFWALLLCLPLLALLFTRLENGEGGLGLKMRTAGLITALNFLLLVTPDLPIWGLFNVTLVAALALGRHPFRKLKTAAFALAPVWGFMAVSIHSHAYRLRRLLAGYYFMDDPSDTGYSSFLAQREIAEGGWLGEGIAFLHGPSMHYADLGMWYISDFALSVPGRQFGLAGVMAVILLFSAVLLCGLYLAGRIDDANKRNLSLLLLILVVSQGFIGIARTLNLMPGLPPMLIPFIGYGRTMLAAHIMVLFLLYGFVRESAATQGGGNGVSGGNPLPSAAPARFLGDGKVKAVALGCVVFAMYSSWHLRRERTIFLHPPKVERGRILDSRGTPLTISTNRQSAWIDVDLARHLKKADPNFSRFVSLLETVFGGTEKRLDEKIAGGGSFLWLKRNLTDWELARLHAVNSTYGYRPVHLLTGQGRSYPAGDVASPLIGFTNMDGYGGAGIEHSYDKELAAGKDVRLSMELLVQLECDRALKPYFKKQNAKSLGAVVLRVRNSSPLAVNSFPTYDPGKYNISPFSSMRLRPVNDMVQFGAWFRPFMLAELLETMPEALAEMNRDEMMLRLQSGGPALPRTLGVKGMLHAASRFELDRKTGIDFDGETDSMVRPGASEKATLFELGNGYGVAGSLMRTAFSFNALINGGDLGGARLVQEVGYGRERRYVEAPPYKQVMKRETSARMRETMAGAVRKATAGKVVNMGGFWATYIENTNKGIIGPRPHHVAGAFFTPVDNPEYLVIFDMALTAGEAAKVEKDLGLEMGTELVRGIESLTEKAKRGSSGNADMQWPAEIARGAAMEYAAHH